MNSRRLRLAILLTIFLISLLGCAAPRGDAEKRYEQNISINCFAPNCNVGVTVMTSVAAEVKKDQDADAKADISPTVDIAP